MSDSEPAEEAKRAVAAPATEAGQPMAQLPARALQRLAAAVQRNGSSRALPSPCINVCRMGQALAEPAEPVCLGCLRSLPEIIEWGSAAVERRQSIWRNVLARMQAVQQ